MNTISSMQDQRVYNAVSGTVYTEMVVMCVFDWLGEQWGCIHKPERQLIKDTRDIVKTINVYGQDLSYKTGEKVTWVPVFVEGKTWMAVHRLNESESWIHEQGMDEAYRKELERRGIDSNELMFTHKHQPHENEIPVQRYEVIEQVFYTPKMTASRLLAQMADDLDDKGRPWFGTQDTYDAALRQVKTHYATSPVVTGRSMAYDEDSQSKSHMRMGWYIQALDA